MKNAFDTKIAHHHQNHPYYFTMAGFKCPTYYLPTKCLLLYETVGQHFIYNLIVLDKKVTFPLLIISIYGSA